MAQLGATRSESLYYYSGGKTVSSEGGRHIAHDLRERENQDGARMLHPSVQLLRALCEGRERLYSGS